MISRSEKRSRRPWPLANWPAFANTRSSKGTMIMPLHDATRKPRINCRIPKQQITHFASHCAAWTSCWKNRWHWYMTGIWNQTETSAIMDPVAPSMCSLPLKLIRSLFAGTKAGFVLLALARHAWSRHANLCEFSDNPQVGTQYFCAAKGSP